MNIPSYSPFPSARAEGLEKANETKDTRYRQILEVLGDNKMTVREIAEAMYKRGDIRTPERQEVAPRVTDMLNDGRLEPAYITYMKDGVEFREYKKLDPVTHVRVAMVQRRQA